MAASVLGSPLGSWSQKGRRERAGEASRFHSDAGSDHECEKPADAAEDAPALEATWLQPGQGRRLDRGQGCELRS